jgi:hypothetical protein
LPRRGHVVALLVCLVLGVVLAIASGIVPVLRTGRSPHVALNAARHDLAGGRVIYTNTMRRPGYVLTAVAGPMPRSVADALDRVRSQVIAVEPGDPRPGWLKRSAMPNPQNSTGIAAGWPFLCLWGRTDHDVNHAPQAMDTGVLRIAVRGVVTRFPAYPLWWGMLANTLLYASVLWLLWVAAGLPRRFLRARSGRCPGCGYELDDWMERCPECGRPVQPTEAASSAAGDSSSTSSRQTTSTLTSKSSSSEDR